MRTGDVYLVSLDPSIGDEINKTRPVVVLSAGDAKSLRLAIVAPVTGWQARWERNPFFVTLAPGPPHGLHKKSVVDCFQLRALSHQRFVKHLGKITDGETDRVKRAIALILDIEAVHCT